MDIITAQATQAFTSGPPGPAAPDAALTGLLVPGAADAQATARFADLMTQPPSSAAAVPAAPATAMAPAAPLHDGDAPATGGSLGDAILGSLKSASADFQDKWASVQGVLDRGNFTSVSELLKLQLGVTQMSVQYEVLGKAVSRSTQNIDQLVKMQ